MKFITFLQCMDKICKECFAQTGTMHIFFRKVAFSATKITHCSFKYSHFNDRCGDEVVNVNTAVFFFYIIHKFFAFRIVERETMRGMRSNYDTRPDLCFCEHNCSYVSWACALPTTHIWPLLLLYSHNNRDRERDREWHLYTHNTKTAVERSFSSIFLCLNISVYD